MTFLIDILQSMKILRQTALLTLGMFHAKSQHIPLHAMQKIRAQPMLLHIGLPELFRQWLQHLGLGLTGDLISLLMQLLRSRGQGIREQIARLQRGFFPLR